MEWLFFGLILLGLAGVYFSIIGFPLFMLLILLHQPMNVQFFCVIILIPKNKCGDLNPLNG